MSAQHTPGPIVILKCPCGHPRCDQHTLSTQSSVGFTLAVATLYAAAPDLLDALNLALEYWATRQQRYKNRHPVWVQHARAALAKVQP